MLNHYGYDALAITIECPIYQKLNCTAARISHELMIAQNKHQYFAYASAHFEYRPCFVTAHRSLTVRGFLFLPILDAGDLPRFLNARGQFWRTNLDCAVREIEVDFGVSSLGIKITGVSVPGS
jgi:hypothetical protein